MSKLRVFSLIIFVFCMTAGFAQSSKKIVQKGISVVKTSEMRIDDGDKEYWIDEIEYYDNRGNLIEYKEYSDKGDDLKKWIKYKYDTNSNLIEEIELNEKGEQKERIVTIYKDDLKIERHYYDDRDRLYKKKKYEYEFRS
ncbi:hypothetical protein ACE01N_04575 [Saccharicrinis sp. FJH2]|uniref:hypothetical protein n=1 Tax=Saccharicrinis sp. FJH65 TaxID=3344659 RepID=UPI0035F4375F